MNNKKRYNSLDNYFKNTFGEKIYKVSLDGGFTCPNRDGTLSTKGCIFCSESGSGDFAGSRRLSINEQIEEQLKLIENKFPSGKVIAYFQNFTNTYADVEYLRKIYYEALSHPRVIGLAIATRPDCLGENIIELLSEINNKYFLWVELGLQTINEEVAKIINRQYSLKTYEEAAEKLKSRNIKFVTHIIIGLPGEKENDSLDTALFSEKCGTWGIKIHLLHIIKNTKLETLYKKNELKIQKKDEYVKKVVKILQNISYNIVIHRLTGDGNRDTLIAPLWSLNKRDVLNSIEKEMKMENIYQGGTEI
ncbi:TIGR01212 family radical SAM protein [Fusobacterium varium]|jgi:radical SAM protein (TIGR01212 family)|uniref:TIGR01212 family radical SAM protein n=1 Tax=Fusobacterium varium TaxID=856 RepID=UPI000E50E18B|nr:TIGR01212 family radical SAM protein [Fusobacterium varium]MCF0169230.1 TIGR01212 family radical SAM protein [Fusobacterium varium]MCF2672438.1 TIGR01212 family radical SAM protein [Fusobacterium varium]RHG36660.1 TIGR01212 family radical SAM protein [Fusobacterium varium]